MLVSADARTESTEAQTARLRSHVERTNGHLCALVLDALIARREATDNDLSIDVGCRPAQVRAALYMLYDQRLAAYRTAKAPETGWFTYYWNVDVQRAVARVARRTLDEARAAEEALQHEEASDFFACPRGCAPLDLEAAINVTFSCPDHAEILAQVDKTPRLGRLRDNVNLLHEIARDDRDHGRAALS